MTLNVNTAEVRIDLSGAAGKSGKYLTFDLASEEYGLEILKVQEIIGLLPVTRVPRTPEFIRGVMNLRGKVIPVIDLRLKFGMETVEDTRRTSIVVVQLNHEKSQIIMGLIVDDVSEVIDIAGECIDPPPQFGAQVNTDFIKGIGKINGKVVILLDVDKVMSGSEVSILEQTIQN